MHIVVIWRTSKIWIGERCWAVERIHWWKASTEETSEAIAGAKKPSKAISGTAENSAKI